MKVFQIKDNSLDLDSQDNRPQQTAKPTYQPKANQQFKQNTAIDGVCQKCGAELVLNPKTGKKFCKEKCWLKNDNGLSEHALYPEHYLD